MEYRPPSAKAEDSAATVYTYEPTCMMGIGTKAFAFCSGFDGMCTERPGGRMVLWYSAPRSNPGERKREAMDCLYDGEPPQRPGGGEVVVVTEKQLRELPIAPSVVGAQPGRHTLKGAETNVYAEPAGASREGVQSFETTVLGRKVRVRVRPVEHRFDYGDGTTLVSAAPGGPVPEARWGEKTATSHAYQATGDFRVGLTTVFAGEFSVEGGPWQGIAGTAAVPSAPRTLSVWRSEVRLYAENCLQNPHGEGC
ncbi:hypothetical protein [Sinomonas sp. ASV322]|uniref:hypothetical protein n=1 Tax=Sinomonas sp. ASV322 TaxID=3041920 RepID=UPI0027DC10D1|nr:hypothetical protein [Sinomonas sp. ASV322]MDQ4502690.1 hypothetical protein [Sinomonas sp. ASV322]